MTSFGCTPTNLSLTSPPLSITTVGTPITPFAPAISGCWSTSSLTNSTPSTSLESSSKIGLKTLQGPHHVA